VGVSGWTDLGFTTGSDRRDNGPLGFNYLSNEPLLQQNYLRIERRLLTTGTDEPSFGFLSDTILPGTDYKYTIDRGLFDSQLTANDGRPNRYGIDPVQFYATAYVPGVGRGLELWLGRFYTPFGYEGTAATACPLFSRSYASIYGPYTNTGLLATLKLTAAWTIQSGLVNGSDVFIDPAASPTYVGTVKWAPPGGANTLFFSTVLGSGRFDRRLKFDNPDLFDFIATHHFDKRLTYAVELYGIFETGVPDVGFAPVYAAVQYLAYDLSPELRAVGRAEFFGDPHGQFTHFPGQYTEFTAGLNWRPYRWLTLRPEARYDQNYDLPAFEGRHWLLTTAVDAVVRW
jgi:hypothetical protein